MVEKISYQDVLRTMTDKINALIDDYEASLVTATNAAQAAQATAESVVLDLVNHRSDTAAHGGYQRPPLPHAGNHALGGADPINISESQVGFNAVTGHRHDGVNSRRIRFTDLEGIPTVFPTGPHAASHRTGGADALTLDESQIVFHTGAGHRHDGVDARRIRYSDLEGRPSTFPPSAHASTHSSNGPDAIDATSLRNVGTAAGMVPLANGTVCVNLNADMLDGKHASDFAPANHTHEGGGMQNHANTHHANGADPITATSLKGVGNSSGQVPLSNGTRCVNLNADLLDGYHASSFAMANHTHSEYAAANHTHSGYASSNHTHTSFGNLSTGTLNVSGNVNVSGRVSVPVGGNGGLYTGSHKIEVLANNRIALDGVYVTFGGSGGQTTVTYGSNSPKTAVVPVPEAGEYREMYAVEASEVLFLEMVAQEARPTRQDLPRDFVEVTDDLPGRQTVYLRGEDEIGNPVWLVVRAARGHAGLRMRRVSEQDYRANERFYARQRQH